MANSADVERSSQKKAAAADRARTAVLDRLARDEGDVFRQGMETHRRTMFTAYGQAIRGRTTEVEECYVRLILKK